MFKHIYKQYPYFLLLLVMCIPILFLGVDSFGRSIFILLSIFFWFVLSIYTKKHVLISLMYIFVVLPFNITYQLPHSVSILGTEHILYDPYVMGVSVNYVIPTISIVDIGFTLLLSSFIIGKGFKYFFSTMQMYKIPLALFLVTFLIQNILLLDLNILMNSVRIVFVTISFLLCLRIFTEERIVLYAKWLPYIVFLSVVIQGLFSFLQFTGGASVGFSFLGESLVVNGMQGSSFIDIGGEIFLRGYGTFPHPNVLGGYVILCLLLLFLFYFYIKSIGRVFSLISLLLFFSVSVLTFSRLTIFLFFVLVVFVVARALMQRCRLLHSFFPGILLMRFENLFLGADGGWRDRVELLKVAGGVLKEKFLLGVGLGNYVRVMGSSAPRTGSGILLLEPVHNVFVLFLSSFGLFVTLPSLFLLSALFKRYWKGFTFLSACVIFSFLVLGFFDHYLLSLPQGLGISFFFGLMVFLNIKGLKKNEYGIYK